MNVMPMVGCGVSRIDAERLDGVDRLQHFFDFPPAGETQEDFCSGVHIGHGRIAFAGCHCAQDIDARDDGAVRIRCPADEGEDAARSERDDAPASVEDRLFREWPNRTQFSMRFLSHKSSTWVRSLMLNLARRRWIG
jgi:hypothetical protein